MLRTLTKEWYLGCYKYQRRNPNVYSNIYSRESNFLFKGNSTIQFNRKKANKQSKVKILMKLTANSVIAASSME